MPPSPAIADCPIQRSPRPMPQTLKLVSRTFAVRSKPAVRRSQPGKDFLQRLREAGL